MTTTPRTRWMFLGLVTILAGASIGIMYAVAGTFQPAWFYTTIGVWALLVLLILLFVGRSKEVSDEEIERDLAEAGEGGVASPALRKVIAGEAVAPAPEIERQPASAYAAARAAKPLPVEVVKPFTMRGFTLFQRTKGDKRFFAKGKKAPAATSIPLPDGWEAVWNSKKKRPELRKPQTAKEILEGAADQETDVTIVRGLSRPCAAWLSPGVLCTNNARDGSQYCTRHAKYKPESGLGQFEVSVARGGKGGKSRAYSMGDFNVRHDAGKGGRPRAYTVGDFNVRHDASKGPKPRAYTVGDFNVRHDGSGHKAAPALKLREPKVEVKKPGGNLAKILKVRETELIVKTPSGLGAAKPIPRLTGFGPSTVVMPKGNLEGGRKAPRPFTPSGGHGDVSVVRDTRKVSQVGVPSAARTAPAPTPKATPKAAAKVAKKAAKAAHSKKGAAKPAPKKARRAPSRKAAKAKARRSSRGGARSAKSRRRK